ncbi:MAG TPA: (2Fe-2S)-binding protein [Gemmataceae bacterium]|nr:(2Fe-2S)-binding protein [Gemmataceae bacterium]
MNSSCPCQCPNGCSLRVVCHCLQVTEAAVVEAITALGLQSIKEIRSHTGAGDGCTACHGCLRDLLERYAYSSPEPICSVR